MISTPMAAKFTSFCPACLDEVAPGASIVSGWADRAYVHAKCSAYSVPDFFRARFDAVRYLSPKVVREVAMALGSTVTRAKKYMGHSEVCYRAASAPVTEDKWAAALSLATGQKTETTAQGAEVDAQEVAKIATDAANKALSGMLTTLVADVKLSSALVASQAVKNLLPAAIQEALAGLGKQELHVKVGETTNVIAGAVHKQFPKLVKMVAARVHVWLAGPAGSGKTTAVKQVAEALGLPFFFNGAIDTEYKLSGFVDAQGKIVSTVFRKAYTEGGVYLFDEVDASMPSAVLAFNAALANGRADFPGATEATEAHPNFRCVAAGNTWGMGATTEYVGRSKMDAAFLDRFVQLTWDYDETLERALATDAKWCERVQKLRARGRERGLKIVISPRATIHGCKLLAAGMTWDEVEEATVRAKISKQDWTNLTN